MPVSALRTPRPTDGEAHPPVPPPPDVAPDVAEENPYSAPEASASVAFETFLSDHALAGRGSRLAAQLLDSLFAALAALPGFLLVFGQVAAMSSAEAGGETPEFPAVGIVALVLGLGALVVYQIWMLIQKGQTLGKKVMNIRIVNNDDAQIPSWTRSLLLRGIVNGALGALPFIGSFYAIADALFIFREDRRCIHDLIAGTKVVEAR